MLHYRPFSIGALAAAMAFSLGMVAPASAEDAKAPPQKTEKMASKGSKAHGAKSKSKTPDAESKGDAAAPKGDKE
jgi:hypothetical protein